MKVYYQTGSSWNRPPSRPKSEQNILTLSYNNWDDFGSKTTLNAALFFEGEKLLEFSLKTLLSDSNFTAQHLNEKVSNGWDGFFPIPGSDYISVPSDIDLYSALIGKIGIKSTIKVMESIRDAGYLKNIKQDKKAIKLIEKDEFKNSLLREAGARKSYSDGWLIFDHGRNSAIENFSLNLEKRNGSSQRVSFEFNSKLLPYDINVLIGPNGVGKSHCLKSLVEYWLGVDKGSKKELDKTGHEPFDETPNISRLILVSYSPFEEYTLDLSDANLLDKTAYKYFGFRQNIERDGESRIGISRNLPASDSAHSLLKAFADDEKFSFMPNWIGKVNIINSVLQAAIGYDELALTLTDEVDNDDPFLPDCFRTINDSDYLIVNRENYDALEFFDFSNSINYQAGVTFLKNGTPVELSSGQRLFCYIVINVAGEIKRDSLVIIDEPELFLHPTLEIEFISLLKKVLSAFSSKAILATHSLAIAREIPTRCVHVFRELEDGLDVVNPPFETFGGDMQRISTYVFGDDSISKPFDEWLEIKLTEYGSASSLISALGREINEEIIIKLLNSEIGSGR
ncbi:ATPase_AAA_core domain-containing protein [Pseudomonas marincola]|uniref:ATPase AAA-type core domain-containing protein n=1 Tax=Pseudomonas marincola TaxID=437900 RepID=A0A653E3H5_9PSED|nr:AAA family ATPase [Pseudomonas marincola]CAE6890644.1 ATPase_AAA_core domain-containing protein [Pseudomonas marincola]